MPAVDMRSDTLTMPSPEMRRAMDAADLGDDVYGEDPTVNRLQAAAADRLGKEAGLLVPSGTMGNLLGILVNARAGQEVIADADSHVFMYEGGGAATLGGIQIRPLATERGVMSAEQVRRAIRPTDDDHQPTSAAVTVEDTHNRHGGVVWPLPELAGVAAVAREHGLSLHMDGARVFNAAVAQGVDVREIARHADTVTFCVSKGLGAPIGSILCGPEDKIDAARRWRKMLGGGWREAGFIAGAALYALESMVDRLAEDHVHARTLGEGLAELPGVEIDLSRVETNLVIFRLASMPVERFLAECAARGLKGGSVGGDRVRFVTHYGITSQDVQHALAVCAEVLAA